MTELGPGDGRVSLKPLQEEGGGEDEEEISGLSVGVLLARPLQALIPPRSARREQPPVTRPRAQISCPFSLPPALL